MVTLAEMQEAVTKARKSGAASARANKPKKMGGRRAKSVGLMTLAGAIATGLQYVMPSARTLSNDPTLEGLKNAGEVFRLGITDVGHAKSAAAMIGIPFGAKMLLGRANPGVGIRKRIMVRLF